MVKLPSDRLLALLTREIDVFEIAVKENKPNYIRDKARLIRYGWGA